MFVKDQLQILTIFHFTNARQLAEAIISFSKVEAVYASFFRLPPDGHRTRLPFFLHGGWSLFAVAAGWEEEQEGWLRQHF